MRELKFRAILRRQGKTVATLYFGLLDLTINKFSIRELLIPWLREKNQPDRYTGLKDKNGREIYEGDIIDFGKTYPHPRRETVEWPEGGAGFSPFVDADEAEGLAIYPEPHQCEIIGNIYENPELLESTKGP